MTTNNTANRDDASNDITLPANIVRMNDLEIQSTLLQTCVACEFPNENNLVQVGYRHWIKASDDEMVKIIKEKKTVPILWPVGHDVYPPNKMKKKKISQWTTEVAIIHAQGEWNEMKDVVKNLALHGVAYLNKEDRKVFAAKLKDDENIEGANVENKIDMNNNHPQKRSNKTAAAAIKRTKKIADTKLFEDQLQQYSDFSIDEEEEDFPAFKKGKRELINNLEVLREENKRLRSRIAQLEALTTISEELPRMVSQFQKLKKRITRMAETTLSTIDITMNSTFTDELERNNNNNQAMINSHESNLLLNGDETLAKKMIENNNYETNLLIDDEERVKKKNDSHESNLLLNRDETSVKKVLENNKNETNLLIDNEEGVKKVIKEVLTRTIWKNNLDKNISEVMEQIFTKEEMATSSLTGGRPNFFKNTSIPAKKQLDPIRVELMRYCLRENFSNTMSASDFEKNFKKRVSQKLNNTRIAAPARQN